MQRLFSGHFATFNTLLLALHAETRADALAAVIVTGLGKLIPASRVVCRVVATADRSSRGAVSRADFWGPLAASYEDFRHEDPLVNHRRDAPLEAALAISDFVRAKAWQASPFYRGFCGPSGIGDQLSIQCPHGADGTLHVVISRADYGGFASADREMLDLLRPHLLQTCGALARPDPSAAALVEMVLGEAVLVFDELMGRFSSTVQTREFVERVVSPARIEKWIRSQLSAARKNPRNAAVGPRQKSTLDYFGLRLTLFPDPSGHRHVVSVRVANDETRLAHLRAAGLTARETEVLLWLARGKSNPEISCILGLRVTTVRTHLRAIFISLGVETRTAAAACAWEILGSLR